MAVLIPRGAIGAGTEVLKGWANLVQQHPLAFCAADLQSCLNVAMDVLRRSENGSPIKAREP